MEDVKDKIKKLLAIARDGRGNENEASTAMRMAETLMRKHSIDLAELQESTGKAPSYNWTAVRVPVDVERPRRVCPMWLGMLAYAVAGFTDCKAESDWTPALGACFKFLGDEHDTEYAVWLMEMVRDIGYSAALAFNGRESRRSFRYGFANNLAARMRTLREERDAALRTASKTGTALIIVNDKIALRDEQFGKQHGRKGHQTTSDMSAYHAGRASANEVHLARPLGGAPRKQIRSTK